MNPQLFDEDNQPLRHPPHIHIPVYWAFLGLLDLLTKELMELQERNNRWNINPHIFKWHFRRDFVPVNQIIMLELPHIHFSVLFALLIAFLL